MLDFACVFVWCGLVLRVYVYWGGEICGGGGDDLVLVVVFLFGILLFLLLFLLLLLFCLLLWFLSSPDRGRGGSLDVALVKDSMRLAFWSAIDRQSSVRDASTVYRLANETDTVECAT